MSALLGPQEDMMLRTLALWILSSGTATALPSTPWELDGLYAGTVSFAGDVNGDGFDDLLRGVPGLSHGQPLEGALALFLGSPTGPDPALAWSYESDLRYATLGTSVAAAGDVNGDGFDDIIAGAPYSALALVFHGSPTGPSSSPDWTASGRSLANQFGFAVAGAGDVNGDGFDDVVVGAPYDGLIPFQGTISLYLGSATGLLPTPAVIISGDTGGMEFGHAVAGAGDVNGDGLDDVVVGAWKDTSAPLTSHGSMTLLYGDATGLVRSGWSARSYESFAMFGSTVSGAGDVNGDGFDDVMAGAPLLGTWSEGAVALYHGGPALPSAIPDARFTSPERGTEVGTFLSSAGDMNGDGYDDIALSSPYYGATPSGAGVFAVMLGGPAGVGTPPGLWVRGHTLGTTIGRVQGGGDVDGDGFDDLIVDDTRGWLRVYPGGP